MLHAKTVLGNRGSGIVKGQSGQAAGEERCRCYPTGLSADMRVGQADGRCAGIVDKRRVGRGVVDVVALHALEEGSEAAAENGLAVSEQILRESQTRLIGLVVVGDQPFREATYARK